MSWKKRTRRIVDSLFERGGADAPIASPSDTEPPSPAGAVSADDKHLDQTGDGPRDVISIGERVEMTSDERIALLGGKGANLAEMHQALGLPVPPAFVITTDACRSHLGGSWPTGLDDRIEAALSELGASLDRALGDPERALLVSVRSGAPVSMPGMMDTVLNVGINPAVRDGLAAETGDPRFAAQTWLRFCRMYSEIVLGVDREAIETAVGDEVTQGDEATADQLNAAAQRLQTAVEAAGGIPLDPVQQVRGAVEAVFESWNSPRAELFRSTEGIAADLGTAVTVQAMVYGNLDDRSGTGVVFTRDPATGEAQAYGDYLPNAQGEDIVAGTHEVQHLDALAALAPEVHGELLDICRRLEHHYRDMCDIEFTVQGGRLHILQVRVGRRSPEAAVRIAVDMAQEPDFPLTRAEAIGRVDHSVVEALAGQATVSADAEPFASGIAASPGAGVGKLVCSPDEAADRARAGEQVVLVRAETSPADVHGMVGAAGLATSLGGSVSHAAVVARSWGIPAVTGARSVEVDEDGIRVGDLFIACGETLTVDGNGGRLFLGDQLADHDHDVPELDQLRQWAIELGIELGEAARPVEAPAAVAESGQRQVSLFEVVRAAALKGMGGVDVIAEVLDTTPEAVAARVCARPDLLDEHAIGLRVTPEGRTWLDAELQAELATVDQPAMGQVYQGFLPLNREFKVLVTDWQGTDQGEAALATTAERLGQLDTALAPVVETSVELAERLAPYRRRFAAALDAFVGGDASMLASPLKDSYHTVWFEYHEELIHLVGSTRLEEEQNEASQS